MANPQTENGYTMIANEILENLIKIDLTKAENKILFTVIRKTYGFHKKEDAISLSQFTKITTLTRQGVCKAIKSLVNRRLLGSKHLLTTSVTTYWFIKDYDKWKGSKHLLTSKQPLTRASKQTDNLLVNNCLHTKESIQKKVKKATMSFDDFLKTLKGKYTWIDVDTELIKMDTWLMTHPGRQKTRRFIVSWLNRIEKIDTQPKFGRT